MAPNWSRLEATIDAASGRAAADAEAAATAAGIGLGDAGSVGLPSGPSEYGMVDSDVDEAAAGFVGLAGADFSSSTTPRASASPSSASAIAAAAAAPGSSSCLASFIST